MFVKSILVALCVPLLLLTNSHAAIEVEDVSLVNKSRVSRTVFQYEFDVTVLNTGNAAKNVVLTITSANPASQIIQGQLMLSGLDRNASGTPTQRLIIQQNRRIRFDAQSLSFDIQYDEQSNNISDSFAAESAYHTGTYPNFFVEQGLATPAQVSQKVAQTYAQLFDLVPLGNDVLPNTDFAYIEDFANGIALWQAHSDNGSTVGAQLSAQNQELVILPQWQSETDALRVKVAQLSPMDITSGATISYRMQITPEYIDDGNLAVQMVIEDSQFSPGFFGYRALQFSPEGFVTVTLENVGPDFDFGYIAGNFDFTSLSAVGFQFLANGKAIDVSGEIRIDDISVSLPNQADTPQFLASFDTDLSNWNAFADNGTQVGVDLSIEQEKMKITPQWVSGNDAIAVKYQQFDAIDISSGASISMEIQIDPAYLAYSDMGIQFIIEDANFTPGFFGFTQLNQFSVDGRFTLSFDNVGPSTAYGYIGETFDFSQLRGIGFQIVANGKPVDISGDIFVDNVSVTASPTSAGPFSNTSLLYAAGQDEAGNDMAYIKTIDTNDIRSEGMSYGMMIAVLMDDKATFDMLWRFTKAYMQNKSGEQKDFFAWRLSSQAPYNAQDVNPAPDGEEYFAMSLFLANNRWGSQEGILNYQVEANKILHDMIYTKSNTNNTRLMMHPVYKQIEFVNVTVVESFSDPSYHLPAFYELFAVWAEEDNDYWHEVAQISRDYLAKAAHPVTGLIADYASHEGVPQVTSFNPNSHKSGFDAFRVMGNMALDYFWISRSPELAALIDLQVDFFNNEVDQFGNIIAIYEVDGTRDPDFLFTAQGRTAMNGFGATVSEKEFASTLLQYVWQDPIPTGEFRYYGGLLHMFTLLHASGQYRIYHP